MSNLITIFIILAAAIFAVYLICTKRWQMLKQIAYALMLQAERIYIDGEVKFNVVFDELYSKFVPLWIKLFLPSAKLKLILQCWYDTAKSYIKSDVL